MSQTEKIQPVNPEQLKFKDRMDTDGIREIVIIGNEREGGCPFNCVGCGVHDKARLASAEANKPSIEESVNNLNTKIANNQSEYENAGYHICVYNEGNVTNKEELSRDNLWGILRGLSTLRPAPKYVSLNSRGTFIDQELLGQIKDLNLDFDINFILGVESLSSVRSEIYGKKGMEKELETIFTKLKAENEKTDHKIEFGMDTGFVFLPEFYLEEGEKRGDSQKIINGFVNDVGGFIEKYVGQGVPIRINLHPYYKITNLPFEDSSGVLSEFMRGVAQLLEKIQIINEKAKTESDKTTIFIGLQGGGYGTDEWNQAIEPWKTLIEKVNSLKVSDNEERRKIIEEINAI